VLRGRLGKGRKGLAALPAVSASTLKPVHASPSPEVPEAPVAELCAICLEPLGAKEFAFPCGHQHRLHHPCAIEFLARVLHSGSSACSAARPVAAQPPLYAAGGVGAGAGAEPPGQVEAITASLPTTSFMSKMPQIARCDVRAVVQLETALRSAPPKVLSRIACPLCRGVWPVQDATHASGVIFQLRSWSLQRHKHTLEGLVEAFEQFAWRRAHSEAARLARLAQGFEVLWGGYHSASTFFASHRHGRKCLLPLLSFLRAEDVSRLRSVSASCLDACCVERCLRVPYVRNPKNMIVLQNIWPLDVATVEIDTTSCGSGWCRRSAMSSEMDVSPLTAWLSSCSSLRELSLRGLRLDRSDPDGARTCFSVASNKSVLKILDLSHNYLTDRFVIRLAETLLASPHDLKILQLAGNCISHDGFGALLPLHAGGSGVSEWGLRHNKIGDDGCRVLARQQLGLSDWDLWTNGITANGCQALLQAGAFENMTALRLGCNPLTDEGLAFLAQGLTSNLQVLDLRQTQLSDVGCLALAEVIPGLSQLRSCLLAGNSIGAAGCAALARSVGCIESLMHLDLSNNSVGSDGVKAIAYELPFWRQVTLRLSLVGVGCDEVAAQALRSAIQDHPRSGRSWTMDLQHNGLPLKYIVEMRHLLEAL